jgi:uncharacterized Tic20 family protein
MSIADELQKLHQLHKSGGITDDEYARAKSKVLGGPAGGCYDVEQQTRQWAMFLHFSLLAGLVVPLAGLILPIVLWQVKKPELPGLDRHGRVVANWIISSLIYAILFALLTFVFIGIPLLVALAIVGIVFPIIGGIKANSGEVWKYPLSITFFPVPEAESRSAPGKRRDHGREDSAAGDLPGAEPDRPKAVVEEKCLQCGRPLPAGDAKCATCGWSYGESVTGDPGDPTGRPRE